MQLDPDDFKRLAFDVRRFLSKADVMARMATVPVLYLELPDIGTMRTLHMEIVQAMTPDQLASRIDKSPWSYLDDHTIKYEPFAGVTIVLSCKQRFAVQARGSVGYRDIAFVEAKLPKLSDK
jgi:hypothetical protein